MPYFTDFPAIAYDIKKDTKLTAVSDLFVRYRIREQVKNEAGSGFVYCKLRADH